MNANFLIVVSRPWPCEAEISVFLAGQRDYRVTLPESECGSELMSLARQYRAQGSVNVILDRRLSRRGGV